MEKRITFTPGPWRVTEDLVTDCPAIVDSLGRRIAVLPLSCPQSGATKVCNAKVLAAAAEMLEVLEWLAEEFDRRDLGDGAMFCNTDIEQVKSVIRKARGEM